MHEKIMEINQFRKEITDELMNAYTGNKREAFGELLDILFENIYQIVHFKASIINRGEISEEVLNEAIEKMFTFYTDKFKYMSVGNLMSLAMLEALERITRIDAENEQEHQN